MRVRPGVSSTIGLVLILVAACGAAGKLPVQNGSLPDGWRWESFMGIEVGVPNDFGWGSSGQSFGQWCVEQDRSARVGRPEGLTTLVGCPARTQDHRRPETQIANTGPIVAFESDGDIPNAGDRTVIHHGKVSLIIQVKEPLRSRIAKTVRSVDDTDWAGCPVNDSISSKPYGSPRHGVDVSTLRSVDRVSVCRYGVKSERAPGLLASTVLTGTKAADAISAIAAAPKGSGPNKPEHCKAGRMREVVVLRVSAAGSESLINVRYDDCDKLGFDDGVAVRQLTKAGLSRILIGPHFPDSYAGHLDSVMPQRARVPSR